jgi:hypothetical protein
VREAGRKFVQNVGAIAGGQDARREDMSGAYTGGWAWEERPCAKRYQARQLGYAEGFAFRLKGDTGITMLEGAAA